jgi:hypothetical protein
MIKVKFALLTVVGIIAAIFWRIEVELHGWDGLGWIGYFHWAIPIGIMLFLGWLFLFTAPLGKVKRNVLVLITAIASVMWFLIVQFALVYHFNQGPSAFVQLLTAGENAYQIYNNLIYMIIPLTPLFFAGLLWVFRLKPTISQLVLAVLIYVLAYPISVEILAMLHHKGGADALHTIKSGIIIPFLIIGLGVLVPKKA